MRLCDTFALVISYNKSYFAATTTIKNEVAISANKNGLCAQKEELSRVELNQIEKEWQQSRIESAIERERVKV